MKKLAISQVLHYERARVNDLQNVFKKPSENSPGPWPKGVFELEQVSPGAVLGKFFTPLPYPSPGTPGPPNSISR